MMSETPRPNAVENHREEDRPLDGRDRADYDEFVRLYDESIKTPHQGEIVRGRVLQVTATDVVVDVGSKTEGIAPIREFLDYEGRLTVGEGDEVDILIDGADEASGCWRVSKEKADRLRIWDQVEKAFKNATTIRGRVIERIKGGLSVDIGVRAFLPGSLVDVKPVKNLDSFRSREIDVKVIGLDKRRGNIVLSRKAVVEVEYVELKKKTLETLREGRVLKGVIKNLTDYGAFVDLGGLDGLLHISDMSYARLGHPSEKVKVGDAIDVVVLKFDPETERVSLGHKQLSEDPWMRVPDKYVGGAKVPGKVVNLTDYGAFVALEDGVEGLIHVSEMSWNKKLKSPAKMLTVGQDVECVVVDVNMDQRRISLSLRAAEPNPWRIFAETHPVGTRVKGVVRNLTDFGAFVELEDGIDGLVHVSDLSWTRRVKHPSEVLQKGDTVDAVVTNVDPDNQRISLSVKEMLPDEWERFANNHSLGETMEGEVTSLTDFGVFVRLEQDIEGLIHISEVDQATNPEDLGRLFRRGDRVLVRLIKVDREERRLGLTYLEKISAAEEGAPETAPEAGAEA